jgi:aspartate/glutamate racemase
MGCEQIIKTCFEMKKNWIIGGVGPESSIEYYRLIITFQEKLNTKDYQINDQ